MSEATNDPLVGRVIGGKYRVSRLVARGGMGRIYLATQEPLGRAVALKVLDARYVQSDQDPEFQKRFFLEAATCARLLHPNTVKVFDYGRLDDADEETYFMVMEYIDGRTLRRAVKEVGYFPPIRALTIAREIARSLREAHRLGIVHRDLKPSNVMLVQTEEGEQIKVLDFGIAKVVREDVGELTQNGRFLGSPRYMSPEIIKHGTVDRRSDLYSLGVLLYEMVCGQVPFKGEQSVQTFMQHLNEPVPAIVERSGVVVPPVVENIARRCLEKQPDARYSGADAFIAAIDEALQELGSDPALYHRGPTIPGKVPEPTDPSASVEAGQQVSRVHSLTGTFTGMARTGGRWLVPVAAALVLIGAGGAAAWWWLARGQKPEPVAVSNAPSVVPVVIQAASSVAPSAPASEAPPPTPATAAPSPIVPVWVESIPAGAEVIEGSQLLGRTPVQFPVDTRAAAPRALTLRLAGYQNDTLELGPRADEPVVRRTLVKKGGGPARPHNPGTRPNLDIRTTR